MGTIMNNFRGGTPASSAVSDGTFNTVINVTTKGIYQALMIYNFSGTTNTVEIKVTIDGTEFNISQTMTNTAGGAILMSIFGAWGASSQGTGFPKRRVEITGFESIPFETEFKVEIKAPIAAGTIRALHKHVEVA